MNLNRIAVVLIVALAVSSCKREKVRTPQPETYIQYFKGTVNDRLVDIKTVTDLTNYPQCRSCDVESIAGDWTGFTNIKKDAYEVSVMLVDKKADAPKNQRMVVRIFDVKKGTFTLTGDEDIYDIKSSFALVLKNSNNSANPIFYKPDPAKTPFKVQITRYEFEDGHELPYVGGELNGTLYNTINRNDSITVKDATFEVRY